jgi:DNA-binding CsgD family transcriptional regulator
MSDPMEGYVFNSEEERRQARKWFEKHAHEIPDMDAGLKINGDPIIYLGIPEEWQLRALLSDRFDRELTEGEQPRNTLVDQLLRKAVIEADLTPLQAWVLALTAFGIKQKQIASTLRVTPQAVIRATKSATRIIGLRVQEA